MVHSFDPGALLGSSYPLPDGTRVRLRLAAASDLRRLCRLLERSGYHGEAELEAARLIRFDPRRRLVLCAATLIDRSEEVIGVGAIDLDDAPELTPDMLIVAGEFSADVRELLAGALVGRAQALANRRAA
jgi:hypothetical protein